MGWDVKATADSTLDAIQKLPSIDTVAAQMPTLESLRPFKGPLLILGAACIIVAILFFTDFGQRLRKVLKDVFFTNWQLALLGTAALVLSLAGGWTTWDGMTNFTGEPVLSLMFTFGIHGVMLIVAWLIGESFATGMSTVPRSGLARATIPLMVIIAFGVVLLAAAAGVYHWHHGISADSWTQALMTAGAVLVALGLLTVFARSDILVPYTQAARIITKNAMLWVMFLACMATSVFFSFDSRFNVVFPQEERKRVADLRAQNQVTGILADIGQTITSRRLEETEKLFQSDGWQAYERHLVDLAGASQGAQGDIERYFNDQIEARNRAIKEQQERIATAESSQAGLASKKTTMTDELSRLEADRPALAAEYAQKKGELDARAKEVDAKRVEAMAEDKGVEGTLKVGKGPVYRERMGELGKLNDYYKIGELRVKDAKKRLDDVDTRISQIKTELAGIEGGLAKYKGEAVTAEQRIKATQDSAVEGEDKRLDPARALLAFDNARTDFRQEPTVEKLGKVHELCTNLNGALASTPATKDNVRGIDCDPKQATEAASLLFALNAGSKAFEASCVGGDKLAPHTSADALFGFAKKCLADAGLPSKDTDALRTKISFTELTRDDRAHRFVVSWNAFNDGNRLAYLALAIAIGIDSLIFMTGLFGANAVRSPLADVPSLKPRNSQQLEAIVENALLPDKFENANLVADSLEPLRDERSGIDSAWTHQIVLPHEESLWKSRVLKVLNAGATIGAVKHDETRAERYLVRSELVEFLSIIAKKAFDSDKGNFDLAELEKIVRVALLPHVSHNSELVLHYMHPINERHGFMAEIKLNEVENAHARTVRNTLNAGATLDRVQRAGNDGGHYFIHRDLYKTLARIRAQTLFAGFGQGQIAAQLPGARAGGSLAGTSAAVDDKSKEHLRLTQPDPQGRRLKDEFRAALLKAIGLDEQAYAFVAKPEFVGSAVAAGKSLDQLKEADSVLGYSLRRREKDLRDGLRSTYQALWSRQADDENRIDLLNTINEEIEGLIPALMLSPRGPYEQVLRQLIEELEQAAGPDDGLDDEQQVLLDRLRSHAAELAMVNRDSPEAWQQIGKLVFAWDDGTGGGTRVANA